MISKLESTIALRYLKPKKKEGFLKVISVFSFMGIALGVAILIIVMSVMNGFRTELINKILGFNPHVIIKPYDKIIDRNNLDRLSSIKNDISRSAFTFSGQGILINKQNTIGVLVRSYVQDDLEKIELINKGIIDGSLKLVREEKDNTYFYGSSMEIHGIGTFNVSMSLKKSFS